MLKLDILKSIFSFLNVFKSHNWMLKRALVSERKIYAVAFKSHNWMLKPAEYLSALQKRGALNPTIGC